MPKRCVHVSDNTDFKISGTDRSPVRVFETILAVEYVVLQHEILVRTLLFLLHNLDYLLDSLVSCLERC